MKPLLLLAIFLLASCGTKNVAGGSSEHENVLQAVILDTAAQPVVGARVWVRSASFLQGADSSSNYTAVSDVAGKVSFPKLAAGNYALEVRKGLLGSFTQLTVDSSGSWTVTLAALGFLHECLGSNHAGDTLKIYGMNRSVVLSAQGCANLDSMPVAQYSLQVAQAQLQYVSTHGLRVDVPAGTPVSAPVWIPLRLGSGDLSARLLGLEAVSSAGEELGVDVDEWDSTAGSGVLWVRLDSLSAAGAEIMLLQDSIAHASTNAFAYAQDGWFHVWHFARNDTSALGNHGTVNASGVLGNARLLSDRSQYFNVAMDTSLATTGLLSFWVRLDSTDSSGQTMLINAGSLQLLVLGTASSSSLEAKLVMNTDTLVLTSALAVGNGAWHLLALHWNAHQQAMLIVDGMLQDSQALAGSLLTPADSLQLGTFLGAVDELRMGSGTSFSLAGQALDTLLQQRHSTAVSWMRF